jgi:polyphosphate kinase
LKQKLIKEILATCLADNVKARELLADGSFRRLAVDLSQPQVRSQERFLELALQNAGRRLVETPEGPTPAVEPPPLDQHQRQRQAV